MFFDRFDVAEGWYWALVECHPGQWSPEYARLCALGCVFRPGHCVNGPSTENAREIYKAASARILSGAWARDHEGWAP